jgi:amylosucrase
MITLRKELAAFADLDNRRLLAVDNPNLLVYSRIDTQNNRNRVLVICNFGIETQYLPADSLRAFGFFLHDHMKDACTGENIAADNDGIAIPMLSFYWLTD